MSIANNLIFILVGAGEYKYAVGPQSYMSHASRRVEIADLHGTKKLYHYGRTGWGRGTKWLRTQSKEDKNPWMKMDRVFVKRLQDCLYPMFWSAWSRISLLACPYVQRHLWPWTFCGWELWLIHQEKHDICVNAAGTHQTWIIWSFHRPRLTALWINIVQAIRAECCSCVMMGTAAHNCLAFVGVWRSYCFSLTLVKFDKCHITIFVRQNRIELPKRQRHKTKIVAQRWLAFNAAMVSIHLYRMAGSSI